MKVRFNVAEKDFRRKRAANRNDHPSTVAISQHDRLVAIHE